MDDEYDCRYVVMASPTPEEKKRLKKLKQKAPIIHQKTKVHKTGGKKQNTPQKRGRGRPRKYPLTDVFSPVKNRRKQNSPKKMKTTLRTTKVGSVKSEPITSYFTTYEQSKRKKRATSEEPHTSFQKETLKDKEISPSPLVLTRHEGVSDLSKIDVNDAASSTSDYEAFYESFPPLPDGVKRICPESDEAETSFNNKPNKLQPITVSDYPSNIPNSNNFINISI